MPWVRFTSNYDYRPSERRGRVTIAFKAGAVRFVRRECASRAIAAGRAEEVNRPERQCRMQEA